MCVFYVVEREEKGKKMITEIYEFGFLSKNGRFVTHICFSKNTCWNPYFYSVFWVRAFWAKVSKKEILDTHQKGKKLTDNWKTLFWYFCCCFCLFLLFFFFVFFVVLSPHLALNPPYFFFFLFFSFLSLSLIEKPCFPPKKGIFLFIFSVSPFFLPWPFWPPPFSVSLSLSLSCSCVSFFLLVFLLAFFLFLVFVTFFIFLSSLLLFHEKNNNMKTPAAWGTQILGKRGVAAKRFFFCFVDLCFAKRQKLSFFGPFFGKFWLMFKKHYKNRHFSTYLKAKNCKKGHF